MSDEYQQNLSGYESEFIQERKGYGSLSPFCVLDAATFSKDSPPDEGFYVGYDIHPENIEALFFEGLKLPRWESIEAETVEQQEAIYRESFQKTTSEYPLISRVSDTDQRVIFTSEEVLQLREECQQILERADDSKAVRALQKFHIACSKAAEREMGLLLLPS